MDKTNGRTLTFMKRIKRFLIILTALLLILPLAGCLVPNEGGQSADATASSGAVAAPGGTNSNAGTAAETFDSDAVAIELGSIQITAGEVESMFDQYISYFSYGYSLDEETLEEFLRMSEEWLIEYYLPLWKAEQLGITLSDEEEASIAAEAEKSVAEERNELLCMFAEEYTDIEESIDDASVLTEAQLSATLDGINAELVEYYGEGFTFDDYLAMRHEDYVLSLRSDRLSEILRERVVTDSAIDQETADQWYETTLEEQKTKYEASPEEFFYDAQDGENGMLILYAPDGYVRVQVLEFVPEGEPDEKIEANVRKMSEYEAEYGALVLNDSDPDRKAEIEAEYAALKAEQASLEEAYFGAVIKKSAEAYDALADGLSFEEAMDRYNVADETGSGKDERLVYVNGVDPRYDGIASVAKTLEPGAYSNPVLVDGVYMIVKLVEVIPGGVVDRSTIEDRILTAAANERKDTLWEVQYDAWLEEAKAAAVYHRETYEMITDLYLDLY